MSSLLSAVLEKSKVQNKRALHCLISTPGLSYSCPLLPFSNMISAEKALQNVLHESQSNNNFQAKGIVNGLHPKMRTDMLKIKAIFLF